MLADTDALKLSQISSAKSDSSSDSSRSSGSVNATPRFMSMKGSKAVTKKPPPFVPRLDLSKTGTGERATAREGLETSLTLKQLQQKPSQVQCDQFENPGRRTSRKTDSARLISLTDADVHFGNNIDSARAMLSRIKRRAKGGSCGGEIGEPINEVNATSSENNIVKESSVDEMGQNAPNIADDMQRHGPSIRDIVESATLQSVPETVSTRNTCNDGEIRTIHYSVAFF